MTSAIENLNRLGGQFLHFAWPMLWQSSLLIALVFAVDFPLARKIRASVRHALWLVMLVKLVLPPALALPTGAAWWLFPAKPVVIPAVQPPVINNYVVTFDAPLPQPTFVQEIVPKIAPPKPRLNAAGWMLLGSAAVSTSLLFWLLQRWWQLARKARRAVTVADTSPLANIDEAFEQARQRAGLSPGPRLKLVDSKMSPAVCGLFRPIILLPQILVEKLSAAQLRTVLLHEMIHLRRRDIWVNCAQTLLQIFYWWHPLVWLANARIRRVREEAVDDAVMLALAHDAETYAPTLLEVAKLAFSRPLMGLGIVGIIGILESRSALRQRIERLVDFRAPRKAGLTFASFCGIFVFSAVAVPMGQAPAREPKALAINVQATDNSSGASSILVGDIFTNFSGSRIARLNADGSLDLNFTNADNALRLLGQRTEVENLSEPQITTTSGRGENRAGIYPAQTFALSETVQAQSPAADSARTDAPNSTTPPAGQTTVPPPTNALIISSTNDVVLFMRTFRMDTNAFLAKLETNGLLAKLRNQPGPAGLDLSTNSSRAISAALRQLFTDAGVDLTSPPGKSVYYKDRRGFLFVTATEADLDKIERVLQTFLPPPLQLHIKARFIEAPKGTLKDFGKYLNLTNQADGKLMGILSSQSTAVALQALRSRKGIETLAEPEITMYSGRQAQMRVTEMITVVTNVLFNDGQLDSPLPGAIVLQTNTVEIGPILDVIPHLLADGYTINLAASPSLKEFLGYELTYPQPINSILNQMQPPRPLPRFHTQQIAANVNLWDGQTLVLGGLKKQEGPKGKNGPAVGNVPFMGWLNTDFTNIDVLVFITATIVDPAGSRVHSEGERAPGQSEIPEQPATTNRVGVEFSTPAPMQPPGHAAVPSHDTGGLPAPNASATNAWILPGPGRQAIVAKLDKIHSDIVSYDALPQRVCFKPEGIVSFSPRLARLGDGLPWVSGSMYHNPERVVYQ